MSASHGSPSVTNASGSSLANLPTNGVTYSDFLNQPNETEADEDEDRLHPYSEQDVPAVIEPKITASISIGDPRARIKELEGQLQSAKILCDRVKKERNAFKGKLIGATGDIVYIERERKGFESKWNNAQIALDAKEEELAARTVTEVAGINNELEGFRVALASAKRKVHELSKENKALAARQAKLAKKEEELTKKEEEMTKTKFTLATRDEGLKNTLTEIKKKSATIKEIFARKEKELVKVNETLTATRKVLGLAEKTFAEKDDLATIVKNILTAKEEELDAAQELTKKYQVEGDQLFEDLSAVGNTKPGRLILKAIGRNDIIDNLEKARPVEKSPRRRSSSTYSERSMISNQSSVSQLTRSWPTRPSRRDSTTNEAAISSEEISDDRTRISGEARRRGRTRMKRR
jgi:hypothetical protein